jgi:hypothetical protein
MIDICLFFINNHPYKHMGVPENLGTKMPRQLGRWYTIGCRGYFSYWTLFLANQKRPVRTGWVWEYINMTLPATVFFLGFSLALFKCGVFQSCWLLGSMDWVQRNSIGNPGKTIQVWRFPWVFTALFFPQIRELIFFQYHFSKFGLFPQQPILARKRLGLPNRWLCGMCSISLI